MLTEVYVWIFSNATGVPPTMSVPYSRRFVLCWTIRIPILRRIMKRRSCSSRIVVSTKRKFVHLSKNRSLAIRFQPINSLLRPSSRVWSTNSNFERVIFHIDQSEFSFERRRSYIGISNSIVAWINKNKGWLFWFVVLNRRFDFLSALFAVKLPYIHIWSIFCITSIQLF